MTTTISRLYNNYGDARTAVQQLEAAGVPHSDIGIIASNADNWYSKDGKDTFTDRDLDGKDDRAEGAGAGAAIGAAAGGTAGLLTRLGLMRSPCCARAATGHIAAAPPSSVMNSRRFIRSPRRRARAASAAPRARVPWRS